MPASTFETITVEVSEEVALLTLNRPDRANTISPTLTREVREAFAKIESDAAVRAVIVTGAGRHFCGGADLRELGGGGPAGGLDLDFFNLFEDLPKPVIAAINGAAMGGGAGLAVAGDMAVMAAGAKLGYPETRHGIVAAIVMANLVRQVGRKAAFELVAMGDPLTADKALALGLVNRVVPDEALLAETLALAEKLAAASPVAMQATKALFHEVADLPLEEALQRGREANKRMRAFRKPPAK